jgi:hypothetical protein
MKFKIIFSLSIFLNLLLSGLLLYQEANLAPVYPEGSPVTGSEPAILQKHAHAEGASFANKPSENIAPMTANTTQAEAQTQNSPVESSPSETSTAQNGSISQSSGLSTSTYGGIVTAQEVQAAGNSSPVQGYPPAQITATPAGPAYISQQDPPSGGTEAASVNPVAATASQSPRSAHPLHFGVASEEEIYRALYGWEAYNAAIMTVQKQLLVPSAK